MSGECVVPEFGEPAAQQHARIVDDSEAVGSLMRMLAIDDLDIPDLTPSSLDFQLQKVALERKWHAFSIDQYALDGRRIRFVFAQQEAVRTPFAILKLKASGEELNLNRAIRKVSHPATAPQLSG
jgi:hypothetical protein